MQLSLVLVSIILFKTSLVPDIDVACKPKENVVACYRKESQQIFISKNLNPWKRRMAFYHEMGHYLMKSLDHQKYKEIFGDGEMQELEEKAAEHFNLWVIGRTNNLTKKEIKFFEELVKSGY